MLHAGEHLTRRALLTAALAALAGSRALADAMHDPTTTHTLEQTGDTRAKRVLRTVTGDLTADRAGLILPHEHVLVDFIGAAQSGPHRYAVDEVVHVVQPHLAEAHAAGVATMIECTPAWLGRDPLLLRRLSAASGVQLVTNTGYYGAAQNKYLPAHALEETAEQLAARWIAEAHAGIADTGVRPGFIKIGVDAGPLSAVHRRLVQAAVLTQQASGLTIASHTGDGRAALDQLAIIEQMGGEPGRWVWVHAQNETDHGLLHEVAARGAWVEFDGLGPQSLEQHALLLEAMRTRGQLGRVLLSHDAGWYYVGEPGGGNFRGYTDLTQAFLPLLRERGYDEATLHALTHTQPFDAFAVIVQA